MPEAKDTLPYRVLARKYRPVDFTTLVGQEAMVRTLRNAIASGRIAHAFEQSTDWHKAKPPLR